MIKLFQPYIPKGTYNAVEKVLSSGQLAQGQKVDEFEDRFSKLFNVKYPISLNSCTSALEMAYELANIKEGDEVITTPLTCIATNMPLLKRKARIVWADILDDTLCINSLDVKSKLTENTKAVVQVHLGGVGADVGKLHIPVISDAAQGLGIFTGDYTCCSFQAIKHITTGDGGMLVVDNEQGYKKAKLMRWFGINRDRKIDNNWQAYRTRMMSFDVECLGLKRHMNDIDAVMGIEGLKNYQTCLAYRKKLFGIYKDRLKDLPDIKLIDGKTNTYWLATVLVYRRDDFARMLFDAGVECNVVQVRNDTYKIFGGIPAELPVLNRIQDKYVSLPIGMHVKEEDVEYICDCIERGW